MAPPTQRYGFVYLLDAVKRRDLSFAAALNDMPGQSIRNAMTTKTIAASGRRRVVVAAGLMLFLLPVCKARSMTIHAEAVLFSYLDRPIFDVIVGTTDLGVSGVYPNTGGGTVSGARFSTGAQSVRWTLDGPSGTPGNGDVVQARNRPELAPALHGEQYLSVHIYPDNTVELIYSKNYPQYSPRGLKFVESRRPT